MTIDSLNIVDASTLGVPRPRTGPGGRRTAGLRRLYDATVNGTAQGEATREEMLIVEDLLLTLMDNKSGAIAGEGTLYYPLGGAVLAELALRGDVTVAEGDTGLTGLKVHAVSGRRGRSTSARRNSRREPGERTRSTPP
ncbi:GPP34 family phosphoprotein [Streptomyces xiamenensis]